MKRRAKVRKVAIARNDAAAVRIAQAIRDVYPSYNRREVIMASLALAGEIQLIRRLLREDAAS